MDQLIPLQSSTQNPQAIERVFRYFARQHKTANAGIPYTLMSFYSLI